MSLADLRRISAHTGRPSSEVATFKPADPEYLDQPDDPAWLQSFTPDGQRRVLVRRENGRCSFLGTQGCELPTSVRPRVCMLYPFDYTERGLRDELSHMCPTQLLPENQGLLEALDMSRERAEPIRLQLYREISEEPQMSEPPCV